MYANTGNWKLAITTHTLLTPRYTHVTIHMLESPELYMYTPGLGLKDQEANSTPCRWISVRIEIELKLLNNTALLKALVQ